MHGVISDLVPAAEQSPPNSRVFDFINLQRVANGKEREMKVGIRCNHFVQLLEDFGMPAIVKGERNVVMIPTAMINNRRGSEVGGLKIESAEGGRQ